MVIRVGSKFAGQTLPDIYNSCGVGVKKGIWPETILFSRNVNVNNAENNAMMMLKIN